MSIYLSLQFTDRAKFRAPSIAGVQIAPGCSSCPMPAFTNNWLEWGQSLIIGSLLPIKKFSKTQNRKFHYLDYNSSLVEPH